MKLGTTYCPTIADVTTVLNTSDVTFSTEMFFYVLSCVFELVPICASEELLS